MPRGEKRLNKLSAPASDQELREFVRACESVDMVPADVIRKLAAAFTAHVREHGQVVLPIRLCGAETRKDKNHGAALETQGSRRADTSRSVR